MKNFDDFKTALENIANRITPSIGYVLIMFFIIASILISRAGEPPAPYNPIPVTPVFIR
jgi:hypothetical protein